MTEAGSRETTTSATHAAQGLHGGLSREQFRDYLRMGFALLPLVVSGRVFNEGCLSLRTLWGHERRIPFFRNEVLVVKHDVEK